MLMGLYPGQFFMVLGNHERSLLRLAKKWERVDKTKDRLIEDFTSEPEVLNTCSGLIDVLEHVPQMIRIGDYLSVQHGNGCGCRHLARVLKGAKLYTEFDDERVEGKTCLGYHGAEQIDCVCDANGTRIVVSGHVGLAGLNKMRDTAFGLASSLIYDDDYNLTSAGRFVSPKSGNEMYVVDSDGNKPGTCVLQFGCNNVVTKGIVKKLY
jgi:hypothetical protein